MWNLITISTIRFIILWLIKKVFCLQISGLPLFLADVWSTVGEEDWLPSTVYKRKYHVQLRASIQHSEVTANHENCASEMAGNIELRITELSWGPWGLRSGPPGQIVVRPRYRWQSHPKWCSWLVNSKCETGNLPNL